LRGIDRSACRAVTLSRTVFSSVVSLGDRTDSTDSRQIEGWLLGASGVEADAELGREFRCWVACVGEDALSVSGVGGAGFCLLGR